MFTLKKLYFLALALALSFGTMSFSAPTEAGIGGFDCDESHIDCEDDSWEELSSEEERQLDAIGAASEYCDDITLGSASWYVDRYYANRGWESISDCLDYYYEICLGRVCEWDNEEPAGTDGGNDNTGGTDNGGDDNTGTESTGTEGTGGGDNGTGTGIYGGMWTGDGTGTSGGGGSENKSPTSGGGTMWE